MYQPLLSRIRDSIATHIHRTYQVDVSVRVERPPRLEMGEVATPVCFDLAKRLKKSPRALAQEIVGAIKPIEGVARLEVAGGGYLNAYLDRQKFFFAVLDKAGREAVSSSEAAPKTIVEHTAINPNKAAHIGHLRNAVLGDTFARILRYTGERVEVQNYIDNTGVQVADVVLGFVHLEEKSLDAVKKLAAAPRFDYLCWDLYARVTSYLEADEKLLELRNATLKAIEEDRGIEAEMAEFVATTIVRRHLETMDRLGITYDLLPRESEILHLKFWDAAFDLLKKRGAIHLATSGKNAGCWVMPLATEAAKGIAAAADPPDTADSGGNTKVIVRSTGTVTYVGKDIAFHLWKFGLLDRDFHYRPFYRHPDGHEAWITSAKPEPASAAISGAAFGNASRVYNVIDSRQAYPQQIVSAGMRAAGYEAQANHLGHLAYDVVALTPRCAAELGYEIAPEDAQKPFIEVSGRKGQGVKADDLLDRLEAATLAEVNERHPKTSAAERAQNAHRIAVGALRYFLLKYTRTTIIAFDFKDALSFEGETGPYCLYAVVRARGIWKKLGAEKKSIAQVPADVAAKLLSGSDGAEFWDVLLTAGSLGAQIELAVNSQEPAFVAKYAFELAQKFNLLYHHHRILTEEDPQKKTFLLTLTRIVETQIVAALGLLGIEAPDEM